MNQSRLIFVYGTLMTGFRLHHLLAEQQRIGLACTEPRYRMYNCGQYPALVEATPGRSIEGELYRVTATALDVLDLAEGVDEFLYERRRIHLLPPHDAHPVDAWFYLQDVSGFADCGSRWGSS